MKFKKVDIKNNILSYNVHHTYVVLLLEDRIYLNNLLLLEEKDYNVGFFVGDNLIYGNITKLIKYDLVTNTTDRLNAAWSYCWDYLENGVVLVSMNRRKNALGVRVADYYFFNLSTNILSERLFTGLPQIQILGKNAFNIENLNIKCFHIQTGELKWEVDISAYCRYELAEKGEVMGTIRQLLGIWDSTLWLYLESRRLIGVLLSTGEIVTNVAIEKTHPDLVSAGFTNGYLDEKTGLVCFLAARYYLEFDLTHLQIHRIKNFNTGHPDKDWNFGITNTFTEEYIYFTANLGPSSGFTQRVGVLNRISLKVEWSQNLGENQQGRFWSLNQAPQVSEDNLYVLDSEGTLHIFEKDFA